MDRPLGIADPATVTAVAFDLDDTLYLQADWLSGAWSEVAAAAAESAGIDAEEFNRALLRIAAEGSDKGGIIDRALAAVGAEDVAVRPLVDVFLAHRPTRLDPLAGVEEMLAHLRADGVRLALVTDGALSTQQSKIDALELADAFDRIVMSDELGRQYRKPHPRPVLEAMRALDATADEFVMVGDRPDKDVASAAGAGARAVRVRTGEYADRPDHPFTWRVAPTAVAAAEMLRAEGLLAGS
ncbi:MAG: HAD-IA family hydrolase [Actinobacteria bacterium]|nr:HAD-IA family hydrolase [Actinomycetota bacterium]MCB9411851.1 HAD-IA family hydrolase [Actinomycetota bacterium]